MYVRMLRYDFSSVCLIGYAAMKMCEIENILECYELSYGITNTVCRDEDGDTAYVRELYIDDKDLNDELRECIEQKCRDINDDSKIKIKVYDKSFKQEIEELYKSEFEDWFEDWDEGYDADDDGD